MHKLLLLLIGCLSVYSAVGGNLIKNGDFENGLKFWKLYRGNWKEPYVPLSSASCSDPGHGKYVAAVKAADGIRAAGLTYEVKLPDKASSEMLEGASGISAVT